MAGTDTIDRGVESEAARARWAAASLYLMNGIGFGMWAASLPLLKERLDLDELGLSALLLSMVGGALVGMPTVGRVVSRFGSRGALTAIVPLFGLALLGPVFAGSFAVAVVAAGILGALKGAFDVSLNSQAIVVEKAVGRPIMARLQALWSLGGLLVAAAIGVVLKFGVSVEGTALSVGLLVCGLGWARAKRLLPDLPLATKRDARAKTGRGASMNGAIVAVGALAFVSLFAEGVMMDWSAVYVRDVASAEAWLAPFAYGMFSCAMAAGRFSGDYLMERLGSVRLLRWIGGLAVAGIALVSAVPVWQVAFVGLGLAGVGIANLVPIFLGAGGRAHPDGVGRGVAAVSTIGYLGFLSGPPLVGLASEWAGLQVAFGLVAILSLFIGLGGPWILRLSVRRSGSARPECSYQAASEACLKGVS
ncbi:MFS transporter [Pelagicoccus enzymogenes]|uniref:MFS transporter n=1 Tax=Pelagicoccus enzymogenes TaxID=2773457 RepID=UPI00280FCE85|nr:MFS transporter [Pelagicoccus enzymogenes]MDQ8200453.1 MFS transporter [Pelagicoccus enzymogenes]